jgi:hypothetical protein
VKLLIDECIGRGIYLKFAAALDAITPPIQHRHLLDFNGQQGVPDDVWVPNAAAEGWIVITGDSGRSGFGAPLHLILPKFQITAIFFAGKLQQQKAEIKGQALIACLAHLPTIDAAPRGSRFKVVMNASGTFRLTPWPLR